MQTAASHSSCRWRAAWEAATNVEANQHVFHVAQQGAQISQSTGYPFCKCDFLQMWLSSRAAPLQSPVPPFVLSGACPTSTIRDSSCSTDSGSLFCTVALIICFFIMLYLCNARWCLCNTPFSCLSHRSFMGKQNSSGAKSQQTHSQVHQDTHVWSHFVSFLHCRFLLLCLQEGQKMPVAKNLRNQTAWTQTSELKRQPGASLLPTFWLLSGLLSFLTFSVLSAGN